MSPRQELRFKLWTNERRQNRQIAFHRECHRDAAISKSADLETTFETDINPFIIILANATPEELETTQTGVQRVSHETGLINPSKL